jgi:hypothetical protein
MMTATVTATAVVMMPLLPPMVTMSMMTKTVIGGRGDLTMTMGQRRCTSMMTAMKVMAETMTMAETAMETMMVTAMMPPPPPTATMSMKTTAAI